MCCPETRQSPCLIPHTIPAAAVCALPPTLTIASLGTPSPHRVNRHRLCGRAHPALPDITLVPHRVGRCQVALQRTATCVVVIKPEPPQPLPQRILQPAATSSLLLSPLHMPQLPAPALQLRTQLCRGSARPCSSLLLQCCDGAGALAGALGRSSCCSLRDGPHVRRALCCWLACWPAGLRHWPVAGKQLMHVSTVLAGAHVAS
jgi:hypothetical protein